MTASSGAAASAHPVYLELFHEQLLRKSTSICTAHVTAAMTAQEQADFSAACAAYWRWQQILFDRTRQQPAPDSEESHDERTS